MYRGLRVHRAVQLPSGERERSSDFGLWVEEAACETTTAVCNLSAERELWRSLSQTLTLNQIVRLKQNKVCKAKSCAPFEEVLYENKEVGGRRMSVEENWC